jgi:acetolactate synthase-1/2/3 large subunit
MRLADAILQRVAQETNTIYMVSGGGAMFLVDAAGRSGLQVVPMIHEQGAGYAAFGHAMIAGFGVCLVTSGPGSGNAVTACMAAWMDSVPMLFISGQAKSETLVHDTGLRTRGIQETEIIRMVKPITKRAYQPESSAIDCMMALEYMILECRNERPGPCWLSVPLDLQGVEV